jgi:beta-lactamase regulating signal transducer with metallopeptidase domain
MWVLIDRLGLLLFDATLSTAVFLSLVMLAMVVCRQPARRLLIARWALCASLAMLPLVALAPLPRLDLAGILQRSKILTDAFGQILPPRLDPPTRIDVASLAPSLPDIEKLRANGVGNWAVRAMTLLDLAGVGTGFAWLVLGVWGVRWLLRQSQEPSAQTQAVYQQLQAGGSRILTRTALRVSGRLQRPAVVGLFQPTILIPASFETDLDDLDQLKLTLLHEMAHVQQHDHWYGAMASLAQTAWFLLPQVWWLGSQLRIDQEFLADRFAASQFGSASGYAASLLLLAAKRPECRPNSRSPAAVTFRCGKSRADARSPLFQRLLMLLHCPHRIETRAPRLWSCGLRATLIGLLLVAACVGIRWPSAVAIEPGGGQSRPKRQPFRIADFVADPVLVPPSPRALAYVIPIILPTRFELSVEVLATHANLARSRIAGQLLGPPRSENLGAQTAKSESEEPESWHPVRLLRDGRDLRLWVDARELPVTMKPELNSECLTIEPSSGHAVRFRNLVVEW